MKTDRSAQSLFLLVFLTGISICHGQDSYKVTLAKRIAEIQAETEYDNTPVALSGSLGLYGDFPEWDSITVFYEDDITGYDRCLYRARRETKGDKPGSSPGEWMLFRRAPPFLFLRDSARNEDLWQLLQSAHPFVRSYAFGALVHRKQPNLFRTVLDHLSDTTRFLQFTTDYGYEVSPADMMLSYLVEQLTPAQKDTIGHLIITRYTHLATLEQILLLHKPIPHDYSYIRRIARSGSMRDYGLIALARYRREDDVELIGKGFDAGRRFSGELGIFFWAIECFPHKDFREALMRFNIGSVAYPSAEKRYYFRALAAYRDRECLALLECHADEIIRIKPQQEYDQRHHDESLGAIYQALEKYKVPMYASLMKKIKVHVRESYFLKEKGFPWEDNPWNTGL